jgi:hypothetical protein
MINPYEVKVHKNNLNKQAEDRYLPILQVNNDAIEKYVDSCLLNDGVIRLSDIINENKLFDTRTPIWPNVPIKNEYDALAFYDRLRDFTRCLANYIKNKYTSVGWLYKEQLNDRDIIIMVTLYV